MRNSYILFLLTAFICTSSFAQLPSNSTAEDWTLTDIDGVEHNLYDLLDQGYTVYLDFSATWCPPCWTYHNSGAYETLYENHGPNGTDEVRVFFIESDLSTGMDDLYGNTAESMGNWVDGTPYPIIDLQTGTVANDYNINYYPTLYAVCPDRKIYEMPQITESGLDDWIESCSLDAQVESTTNVSCFGDDDGTIDISADGGNSPDFDWSHGAHTEDVSDLSPGTYHCTISDAPVANDGGSREILLENIEITGPPSPVSPVLEEVNDILCNGDQSGMIDVSVSGGTPGYTYLWSNGATTEDLNNLSGGTYTLTIADENACEEVISATVEEPTELLLEVIPENATCGEENGALTVIGSGGTGDYLYDIGNGPTSNEYFPNLSPATYNVTVLDDNNCETVSTATIENIPPPEADAGENAQLDCSGDPVELDGTASEQGTNISYEWTTSDGHIVEGGNTLTPLVDKSGVYTMQVTDNNSGCISEDIVAVIAPPGGPEADAGPGQVLNCSTIEIELDGSGSTSGGNISYEWHTNDGHIISGESSLHPIVDEAGTYILTVTNDDTGCSSTSEVEVTLDESFPQAEIQEPGVLNCVVGEVMLDASGSEQGPNISYYWTDEEGNTISDELTVIVGEAGTYSFHIENSENGCAHSVDVTVDTDMQVPEINAGDNAQLTCAAPSVHLQGSIELEGNYSVLWSTNEGNIISAADSIEIEVDETGWYVFTVTDEQNGCTAIDSVQVTLDESFPEAQAAVPGMLTCEVTTVTLDGTESSSGQEFTYEWSTSDGHIVSGAHSIQAVVDEPGTYTLIVTNTENGCTSTTTVEVDEITEAPEAAFTSQEDGNTYKFNDMSSGVPSEWQWDFGDGSTSDEQNPTHVYSSSGTYEVCLTVVNDCGEHTRCVEISVEMEVNKDYESNDKPCACPDGGNGRLSRDKDCDLFETLELYPNPASSYVRIQTEWDETHRVTIQLKNAFGKTYRKLEVYSASVDEQIDFRRLPGGMYILAIEAEGMIAYRKILKQ